VVGSGKADAVVGAAAGSTGAVGCLSLSVCVVVQWAVGGHHWVPWLVVVAVGGGDGVS